MLARSKAGIWTTSKVLSKRALKLSDVRLYDFVRDVTDLDEGQFSDAVERNLRVGRILLLIVGDGIQEGVESLTEYLQLHAGIHVGVALVELSLWRLGDGSILVVPRVPMKTVIIERGIVSMETTAPIRIMPPKPVTAGGNAASSGRRVTLSEEEFLSRMDERRPGLRARLLEFVASLAELGVALEVGKTAVLRWRPSPQVEASAGLVDVNGKVWFGHAYNSISRTTSTRLAEAYFDAVAQAAGGHVRRYEKEGPEVLDANGKALDATRLLDVAAAWKEAIAELIRNSASNEA